MSTKKRIFRYKCERFTELVTKINDPVLFAEEKMNEVGAQGKRCMNAPIEFQEPSKFVDAQQRVIPYYGIMLFTEELVTVDDETSPI